jgi:hypothetical protein
MSMSGEILGAMFIGANPGPAVHLAVLGAVIVIGLAVFGVIRLRRRQEAATNEDHPGSEES